MLKGQRSSPCERRHPIEERPLALLDARTVDQTAARRLGELLLSRPDHLGLVRRAHERHHRRLGSLWAPRLVECFEDAQAHHGTSAAGWEVEGVL